MKKECGTARSLITRVERESINQQESIGEEREQAGGGGGRTVVVVRLRKSRSRSCGRATLPLCAHRFVSLPQTASTSQLAIFVCAKMTRHVYDPFSELGRC